MGAIVVQTSSVLRCPTFSSLTNHPRLGKPTVSLRDVLSPFERKDLRLTISCIGPDGDGDRTGWQPPRRSPKKEENKRSPVRKKLDSANQEEIIALFRRIQSSISKEKNVNDKKINADASEEGSSMESILEVLSRTGKQGKAKNEERKKISTRKRVVPKKDYEVQDKPPPPPVANSKLARPPSKFTKRSPIPFPTTPRGTSLELSKRKPGVAGTEYLSLPKVDEMKLAELRQLARSRRIKGYSRLKKSELVGLLRSQVNDTHYSFEN